MHKVIFLLISIICLSGCFEWAARAKDKLPTQTALDKTYNYDGKIIIIGAGASGLAAAKVLEQSNLDYSILEASDRYGGRLKKDTTLADFPIDIGAEWIHSDPIVLNLMKGKKGEDIDEQLLSYRLENTGSWDGQKYKENRPWLNNFVYNFMPESKFKNSTWYDFVDEHLAQYVKHNIKYNQRVTEIDYSDKKIIIKTENNENYVADKVLVTVSLGVLKSNSIKFTPDLNAEMKKAIDAISFDNGFKIVLKFADKFYPDAITCEVESGEKVYYDIAFKKDAQTNVLGVLCRGDEAQKYYDLNSEKKIIDNILLELDEMFDEQASKSFSGEYIFEDWGRHKFTLGTWTQASLEKNSHLKALNQSLDNKVYFAGEIYDQYKQMGVPGAVLSGYYSIDKLITEE